MTSASSTVILDAINRVALDTHLTGQWASEWNSARFSQLPDSPSVVSAPNLRPPASPLSTTPAPDDSSRPTERPYSFFIAKNLVHGPRCTRGCEGNRGHIAGRKEPTVSSQRDLARSMDAPTALGWRGPRRVLWDETWEVGRTDVADLEKTSASPRMAPPGSFYCAFRTISRLIPSKMIAIGTF